MGNLRTGIVGKHYYANLYEIDVSGGGTRKG